jgi:hypothetical protein
MGAENRTMRLHANSAPALARLRTESTPLEPTDDLTPHARLRVAVIATACGLAAFLLIQASLATYNVQVVQDAIHSHLVNSYPSVFASLSRRLFIAVAAGTVNYLGFALVGVVIAGRGHRFMFALPAVGFVLISAAIGYSHTPLGIGNQWQLQCFTDVCNPWFIHPWFGPLVDLALILVPGRTVAIGTRPRRWPPLADRPAVAAILVAIGLVAVGFWATSVIDPSKDLKPVVAVLAMGLAVGTARPWWPWLHVLFASLCVGSLVGLLDVFILPEPGNSLLDLAPFFADQAVPMTVMVLLASAWQPLAWVLRRLAKRPLGLVVAVNALNVVDAIMTALAVRSGDALEANPVVRFGGLPAKVAMVGLLTWLLYRRRPDALLWPAAALVLVFGYHLGGILVNR